MQRKISKLRKGFSYGSSFQPQLQVGRVFDIRQRIECADSFPLPHKYVSPAGLCDPACSREANGKTGILSKYDPCTNTSHDIAWKLLKANRLTVTVTSLSLQEVRDEQVLEVVWVSQTDRFIPRYDANKSIMVKGRDVLFGSRYNAFPY